MSAPGDSTKATLDGLQVAATVAPSASGDLDREVTYSAGTAGSLGPNARIRLVNRLASPSLKPFLAVNTQ